MWIAVAHCFKEENHQGNPEFCLLRFSKITSKKDALPVPLCLAINNQLEHLLEIEQLSPCGTYH
jgi:hypothetical protein